VPFVGGVFGLLVVLLFLGQFVSGSLFPSIFSIGFTHLYLSPPSWAKLMIWTFIGGFSERFVPELLGKLVESNGNIHVSGGRVLAAGLGDQDQKADEARVSSEATKSYGGLA
jgi:hypothetical protein